MTISVQNPQLQQYLQAMACQDGQFTENKLKIILGAACMRYLAGLTDITFVLELSESIRNSIYHKATPDFQRSIDILHNIAATVHENDMQSIASKTHIHIVMSHIQKSLTGIPVANN